VALLVLPLVLQAGATPGCASLDMALLYVLLALGLNIVVGYAGLLDLGYVAFYAVGAYMFGLLASPHLAENFPPLCRHVPQRLHTRSGVVIPLGRGWRDGSACCWARPR
jgi:branched-chain amino acid transport system permease protein